MDFFGLGCGSSCDSQLDFDDVAALAAPSEFSLEADEQAQFHADYYCPPDKLARSVGAHLDSWAEAFGEEGEASGPASPADFDADVPRTPGKPLALAGAHRGLLPCARPWLPGAADAELDWLLGPAEDLPPAPLQPVAPPFPSHELGGLDAGGDGAPGCPIRFEEGDAAPVQPQDPYFRLLATSVLVRGLSAAAICNALLDFLDAAQAGAVEKVNRAKCSVRARVAVGGSLRCVLKARVYARPSDGGVAVEFRRCLGDGVAFNEVFQRALSSLRHLGLEVVHLCAR